MYIDILFNFYCVNENVGFTLGNTFTQILHSDLFMPTTPKKKKNPKT